MRVYCRFEQGEVQDKDDKKCDNATERSICHGRDFCYESCELNKTEGAGACMKRTGKKNICETKCEARLVSNLTAWNVSNLTAQQVDDEISEHCVQIFTE